MQINPMQVRNRKEFKLVAECLEKQKDPILHEWKRKMQESKQKSTRLASLSHEKFFDHLPEFLNHLIEIFLGENDTEKKPGKLHGEERWENGLDLRQVTHEWSVLHDVIIEQVSPCLAEYSFDMDVFQEIQKILALEIHQGIKNSINAFYGLEKRKAQAQLRDLRNILRKQEKKVTNHQDGLQQTSHDIKGNLLSLRMAISLLKDREFEDKETNEILNEMTLAAKGLSQLLEELFDLFNLEAGNAEINSTSFDVAKELQELCKSMQPMASKKGLDLQCSGVKALTIKGDRKKIRRIAQNLLLNALKYTASGKVEVHWENKEENQWLLKISDTGPGLSYTHVASLSSEAEVKESSGRFDSEVRDTEQTPPAQNHGEGIGLLIVRELCQLMNGIIEVDTAPGEGTTFSIILPVDISQEE